MNGYKLYYVKIVNLAIVFDEYKEGLDESYICLSSKEQFKNEFNKINDLANIYDELSFYIDGNCLTIKVDNDEYDAVYQIIYTHKYLCFNYKVNDLSYSSYLLFEEVEIEPIF